MQPTRTAPPRTEAAERCAAMPPAQPAPIAGPRRARSTPPPLPADVVAASTTRSATPQAVRPAVTAARTLVPLDYDQVRPAVASAPTTTATGATGATAVPRRSRRAGWFILGVALGALGAVWATGETGHTLRTARAWGGSALRSLEHKPASTAPAPPHASSVAAPPAMLESSKPCPMEPSADDPCAALLAPFASRDGSEASSIVVPTVPVEDLPRVKPPLAAAGPHVRAAAATRSTAPATTTETPGQDAPRGINPNVEDSQASPEKTAPARLSPGPDVDPAGTAVAPT